MITREEKNKVLEDEIVKEKRRKKTKIIIKITTSIFILFTLTFLYMYFIGIKYFKENEYVISDNDLPKSFDGVKILHFTDLLYSNEKDLNTLDNLMQKITLINPDIIVFTGNLISDKYKVNEEEIKKINNFMQNIPYKIGKYAIYGNLDNTTYDLIMENTNFQVLNNEVINIYNNSNDSINIVGININNDNEIKINNENYTITLIHNYDNYDKYNINSNLIMAGSNLGGEIKIFGIPLLRNNEYMKNYYENNNSKIFISNGIGSPHHLRLFNHPSMNVYRLFSDKQNNNNNNAS